MSFLSFKGIKRTSIKNKHAFKIVHRLNLKLHHTNMNYYFKSFLKNLNQKTKSSTNNFVDDFAMSQNQEWNFEVLK